MGTGGQLGSAIHSGLPEDVRPDRFGRATVELRLFNTHNSICNASLRNTRGCA
ncbi:hypothetical protein STRTUCAR8_03766 [Streptomyces turgidiscabies Car8]|uniref:Uncharacterized protein n=1 Tax=Streptomyces turgidiscabies (strain Car8) TaxID=698760 RepID=L7F5L4_STRT8|nr:hypothetical protein STRTUCAR8_03766 [Streptomyces turgidiscabies Car8]